MPSHVRESRQLLWLASLLAVIACAPSPRSPCAARPGFDQEARIDPGYKHTDSEPGVVHVRSPGSRAELIDTLRAIAKAIREAPDDKPMDVHVDIPLSFFEGLSCVQIFEPFDAANFCQSKPRKAKIYLYYLPPNWMGGGTELNLHFDENGNCDGAGWCATQ